MGMTVKVLAPIALAVLAIVALVAGAVLLDRRPLVPVERTLSQAERTWARQWLASARPRGGETAERRTLSLTEPEANLLAAYLVERLGEGRVALRLEDGRARAAISLGLPWDPEGSFVNLELALAEPPARPARSPPDSPPGSHPGSPPGSPSGPAPGQGEPPARLVQIERARLAGLPLPQGLVQALAERALEAVDRAHVLKSLELDPGRARLGYEWRRGDAERIAGALLSPAELRRLIHYQGELRAIAAGRAGPQSLGLAGLLSALLAEAAVRSDRGDPAAENRAAILALAAYASRRSFRDPAEGAGSGSGLPPAPPYRQVELAGRADLAQHFAVSAALAIQGGESVSNPIGLLKELADSRGGSGFSFPDLAADRAGTRFALLATGDRQGALRVQTFARRGLSEDDFLPALTGLPEGLRAGDLRAAYGDPAGPAFRRIAERIERSLDTRPLFRRTAG